MRLPQTSGCDATDARVQRSLVGRDHLGHVGLRQPRQRRRADHDVGQLPQDGHAELLAADVDPLPVAGPAIDELGAAKAAQSQA